MIIKDKIMIIMGILFSRNQVLNNQAFLNTNLIKLIIEDINRKVGISKK